MKYFAKYIPIKEEEVKREEDKLRLDLQSKEIFTRGSHFYKMSKFIQKGSVPVKLFLCSNNIQRGDNYFEESGEEFISLSILHKSTDYKIIGEISNNAIWIKEGDIFEESDWSYAILNKIDNRINNINNPNNKSLPNNTKLIIIIKCQNCQIFH